jgi:hypothetical protein
MASILALCLLVVAILLALYLELAKTRYEKWVDKKFPLPHRMRFISDDSVKDVMGEITLNRAFREMRSISMALMIGIAVLALFF